jgi:hypothetical protein
MENYQNNIQHFNEVLLNYNIFKIERDSNLQCTYFHMEMDNYTFHIVYKIDEFGIYFNECCLRASPPTLYTNFKNVNERIKLGHGCDINCPLQNAFDDRTIYYLRSSYYGNLN